MKEERMAIEGPDRFAQARRELQEAADRFKQRSSTLYGRARSRSKDVRDEMQDGIRRRPGVAVLTSLALGILIGSVFFGRRD
jgi:ElaB/YqjD/DUF883 family membrane-anchored ribosome-binding protein